MTVLILTAVLLATTAVLLSRTPEKKPIPVYVRSRDRRP